MESARKLLLIQSPQEEFPNHMVPNIRNASLLRWLFSVSSFLFSISMEGEILTILKAALTLSKRGRDILKHGQN